VIEMTDKSELRYAVYDPQDTPPRMKPEDQVPWDEWANSLIEKRMESFARVIGDEVGRSQKELRLAVKADIDLSRAAINSLRDEVSELKMAIAYLKGRSDRDNGEEPPLLLPKRGSLNG
jgi:hypothetical protein